MKIEFDPIKDQANIDKHGISLKDAALIDLATALVEPDSRNDYSETRYNALGKIGARVHHLTFTIRNGVVRAISLRKANKREVKRYVKG